MIWSYSKRYFINPSLKENLSILLKLLKSDYKWEPPIVFLIPRYPDFTADGDSSLVAAGASIVAINNLNKTGVDMQKHDLVLIKANITAAECWAKRAALMIQYGIGIDAAYIPKKLNTIPDYISRELLSLSSNSIVLNTNTLDPTEQIKKLGQFETE
eukprot:10964008-Ditylum_brightwellii.AAC.1